MPPSSELQSDLARILTDRRSGDEAHERELSAEYGTGSVEEAVYLLAEKHGWPALYDSLVDILLDDGRSQDWEIAQVVLFYASSDHRMGRKPRPMPADSTLAHLYNRFPDGNDDGDRIWAIVCDLKGVKPWSDYDPLNDPGVAAELNRIQNLSQSSS